jgi:hypothetical protein
VLSTVLISALLSGVQMASQENMASENHDGWRKYEEVLQNSCRKRARLMGAAFKG